MNISLLTHEQHLALSNPAPDFEEALKGQPRQVPEYDFSDPHALILSMRERMKRWNSTTAPDDVVEKDVYVGVRDGEKLRVRCFGSGLNSHTQGQRRGRPLFVLYHGGGFTIGSPESLAPLARVIVSEFDAVVVAPAYRLAPEHPFPIGMNDSYDAFKYIVTHLS